MENSVHSWMHCSSNGISLAPAGPARLPQLVSPSRPRPPPARRSVPARAVGPRSALAPASGAPAPRTSPPRAPCSMRWPSAVSCGLRPAPARRPVPLRPGSPSL
ncbi:hypothetical protein GUJ93_ZPchr0002g23475 [Zizania palustris]|uniref:Uncharacterized protein n=1 Tax=Zizania palustris TaxID=103762 RepID=A0A8J5RVR3_ZIZPA|nr:hypothetical protein GUJ93_ZPchr0002g23475 [Zizania palustris]